MRLSDLNPRWFTLAGWASPSRFAIGLTFQCPHCASERLGVLFDRPVDPDGIGPTTTYDPALYATANHMHVWKRSGDTFETLTLTPSIDGSGAGHWHGFITNGDVS